jgi:lipopolysaccharide/colanic/teichoic acid biosynthesis glycosyltransferase
MLAKRIFDVMSSAVALVLLFPLTAVISLLVLVSLGTPVLFRRQRPGKDGGLFTIYKFRTMRHGAPGEPDADRLTRFGRWLRGTSLDELPELWNVLRGDMSMVGPRPLLMEYIPLYTPDQMRRHEVRPGLTGWAQVHGRNALDWNERFRLDVWYVDNWSFALDMKIIGMTIWTVLSGKGVSQPGHATMPEFKRLPAESPAAGKESADGSQGEHRA